MNYTKIKAISLFANVGIAEAYLEKLGIEVVAANEIDQRRVDLYKHVYPTVNVIVGDIADPEIKKAIIQTSKENKVELIMATPPCQGMSTAGKMDQWDERNSLVCHAIEVVKAVKPKYVFLENVPQQLKTKIHYHGEVISIPDYIKAELEDDYVFNDDNVIEAADYGIPQYRERVIMLLVHRSLGKQWSFPEKTNTVTLEDAIGKLPSIDPFIYDVPYEKMMLLFPDYEKKKAAGLAVSKWHYPPKHIFRQVWSMMHTPTGCSAFDNKEEFQPRKKDGSLVSGFHNTYTRQRWDHPGSTVTMYSREISSQSNVHPGRLIGDDKNGEKIYSDARVMTIYELMIMSSLPPDWNIPDGVSDHFLRCVIGEGIPPLLVKKIMEKMLELENE